MKKEKKVTEQKIDFTKGEARYYIDEKTGEGFPMIKKQTTARFYPKDHEQNYQPSKTVPGLTMTIAEMVARYRKGLPIDESKGALYQGDDIMPDISKMDLIDRQNYIDSVADALVDVRNRIQESVKSKEEQEILNRIDNEVKERLKKINELSKNNSISDIEEIK